MTKYLLLFVSLLLITPGFISAQNPQRWPTVKPNVSYRQPVIAIVPFNSTGTSLDTETIPRIIRNDLRLSGLFSPPEDQTMANRQNIIDHRRKSINFEFWREKIGAQYYLMGNLQESNGQLQISALLYDIPSQRLVLNRKFSGSVARMRDLAHQVSDAIILQIHGIEGACRTKILFVTEQVPGTREIAICDWDGFGAKTVTNFNKIATNPTWGSNGTEQYFLSYHGNRANIYGMQLVPDSALRFNPGSIWTIAAYGGTNHSPAWSPAARRIALVLSKDGNSEIYTVQRDGKNLQRLTRTKATEGSPAWSPDGTRIAYTSNEAGGVHLFSMNANGSQKRQLTRLGSWNDAVSWSPDGTRLAFVSRQNSINDIYVCDADGSNIRRLTQGKRNNESPSWAPNGTHLIFSSDRSGRYQLYIMLDDGSQQNQITTSGANRVPDWGPFIGQQ